MVDVTGREIQVGDQVVYPGRHGSSMWLNRGYVIAPRTETETTLRVRRVDTNREVEVMDLSRVAVVAGVSAFDQIGS
jgi:hypothetical protein